jgi:AraC-like DNA-binding protein
MQAVLDAHGPVPLLHLGLGLDAFTDTPIARIFARAGDPHDVVARWRRMERYFHSRHRVVVTAAEDSALAFDHIASSGPAPGPGEDIVVAAMLAALATWRGARGVDLIITGDGGPWCAIAADRVVATEPLPAATAGWCLSWRDCDVPPAVPNPTATAPVRAANGRALAGRLARRVFDLAARDPGRRLGVAVCAGALGMSPRTLQRRLAEEGTGCREIAGLARLQAAADLLASGEMPIALVGLLAGYADQPHFNREFRRLMDMTPAVYRKLAT